VSSGYRRWRQDCEVAKALARLLKLRYLLEESSRMELERRAALAARVEEMREGERARIRAGRERVLESICGTGSEDERLRLRSMEWRSAEDAARREQQLGPVAEAVARRVEEGREEFLERRKERLQVEKVLEEEQERLREEQERRTQRDLDDWFGMKQVRERRGDEPS
jgi:hypothetical protein